MARAPQVGRAKVATRRPFLETAELAIITAEDDPNVPDVHAGEQFELSRSGLHGIGNAAQGRIVSKVS